MMRMMVALALGILSTGFARAEGPKPSEPGMPFSLLIKPKVQKELGLTPQQIATVKKLHADVKSKPAQADAARKAVYQALKLTQMKRLAQITYQVKGGAALDDGAVAATLGLSPAQTKKIHDLWINSEKDLRMLLSVARFRTPEIRTKYIADHRKKVAGKMLDVLTPEQKKIFAALAGKPFDTKGLDG